MNGLYYASESFLTGLPVFHAHAFMVCMIIILCLLLFSFVVSVVRERKFRQRIFELKYHLKERTRENYRQRCMLAGMWNKNSVPETGKSVLVRFRRDGLLFGPYTYDIDIYLTGKDGSSKDWLKHKGENLEWMAIPED